MNAYAGMLHGRRAPQDVSWAAAPLFARLREHHFRGQGDPLDVALDAEELGDDVMNAFMPAGCELRETSVRFFFSSLGLSGEDKRLNLALLNVGWCADP